jgi:hypothetical protein
MKIDYRIPELEVVVLFMSLSFRFIFLKDFEFIYTNITFAISGYARNRKSRVRVIARLLYGTLLIPRSREQRCSGEPLPLRTWFDLIGRLV